ncbi:hypothetical protein LZG74_25395 [Dyadobacter sp. CY327]|uniref:DUF7167 family protein n=1 Tax=Dyadobacter sp. CY327 TaxID=2907301 RepID=UPI001F40D228|nr:hypothetical protein [Dyadobacter sp. CY327]MCE7073670.1 hypothetical protein [Dyadobacter sp. CY327]
MKIRFWYNGATIGSDQEDTLSLDDLGYTMDQWNKMTDEEKYRVALEWAADNGFECGFEEIDNEKA